AEPVLVAWGIDTNGKPCFLGLAPGAAESTDAWRALLEDLKARGLGAPLLVISDGGKGLCTAIERSFLHSLHQRCLVHGSRKESTGRGAGFRGGGRGGQGAGGSGGGGG